MFEVLKNKKKMSTYHIVTQILVLTSLSLIITRIEYNNFELISTKLKL